MLPENTWDSERWRPLEKRTQKQTGEKHTIAEQRCRPWNLLPADHLLCEKNECYCSDCFWSITWPDVSGKTCPHWWLYRENQIYIRGCFSIITSKKPFNPWSMKLEPLISVHGVCGFGKSTPALNCAPIMSTPLTRWPKLRVTPSPRAGILEGFFSGNSDRCQLSPWLGHLRRNSPCDFLKVPQHGGWGLSMYIWRQPHCLLWRSLENHQATIYYICKPSLLKRKDCRCPV